MLLDVPDNVTAAAISLVVSASGAGALKTRALPTPQEVDAAATTKVG